MVAMGLWGQTNAGLWLLDMINQRLGFSDTLNTIKRLHQPWSFNQVIIEDKANGSAVIDSLKQARAGFSVYAVEPDGGKVARANASTPQFNQGRVWFPRRHPLSATLTSQLLKFPGDTYDDLVDMVSQAINFTYSTGPMRTTTAYIGRGGPPSR